MSKLLIVALVVATFVVGHDPLLFARAAGDAANGQISARQAGTQVLAGAKDTLSGTSRALRGLPPTEDAPASQRRIVSAGSRLVAGDAPRGDVDAALSSLTRTDGGQYRGAVRWDRSQIHVSVVGDAADATALAELDQVLLWLSDASEIDVHRVSGRTGDIVVTLARGAAPSARIQPSNGTIVAASAQWDPTHPWSARWQWEEMLHVMGPYGDHGPAGSVLSSDQQATSPSDFDRWVIEALYGSDSTGDAALRAALQSRTG
jgi:hypothetical protein